MSLPATFQASKVTDATEREQRMLAYFAEPRGGKASNED